MPTLPAPVPPGLPATLAAALQAAPDAALYKQIARHCLGGGALAPALRWMQAAAGLAPDDGDLQREYGCLLAHAGDHARAVGVLEHASALQPGRADNAYFLGLALLALRRGSDACLALQRACACAPDDPRILRACAEAVFQHGFPDDALPLWAKLHGLQPDDATTTLRHGECLTRMNRVGEASRLFNESLVRTPDAPELQLALAQSLEAEGDRDRAERALRTTLRTRPGWTYPLATLIGLLRGRIDDATLAYARERLAAATLPAAEQAQLGYEVGKALDARGEHAAAFATWQLANHARQQEAGVPQESDLVPVSEAEVAAFATPPALAPSADRGDDLVFVVGMPRSGTTLTEQILAAHPAVHGCGELPDIALLARRLGEPAGRAAPWPPTRPPGAAAIEFLRRRYRQRLAAESAVGARRWIDKSPLNYHFLGLIALAFPAARIVWCQREPRDIAISVFGENFAPGERWATSLVSIGWAIRQQRWQMQQWQQRLPNPLLPWSYEALLDAPEAQVRRLLDFLGLDWSERCLQFHQHGGHVLTPSRWQVRQSLHKQSTQRWRHYAEHFAGFDAALGLADAPPPGPSNRGA